MRDVPGHRWLIAILAAAMLSLGPSHARAGAGGHCTGDCNADGEVTVDDLLTGVRIALGDAALDECTAMDADSSEAVDVAELIEAVGYALSGCPPGGAVFVIRACASPDMPTGETFRVRIEEPDVIAEADSLIGAGNQKIISGQLAAGDGRVNAPWSWHLVPDTIGFADITIELCDGCPRFVEEDLGYWLGTVGMYCPWSTEVVRRER